MVGRISSQFSDEKWWRKWDIASGLAYCSSQLRFIAWYLALCYLSFRIGVQTVSSRTVSSTPSISLLLAQSRGLLVPWCTVLFEWYSQASCYGNLAISTATQIMKLPKAQQPRDVDWKIKVVLTTKSSERRYQKSWQAHRLMSGRIHFYFPRVANLRCGISVDCFALSMTSKSWVKRIRFGTIELFLTWNSMSLERKPGSITRCEHTGLVKYLNWPEAHYLDSVRWNDVRIDFWGGRCVSWEDGYCHRKEQNTCFNQIAITCNDWELQVESELNLGLLMV